MTGSFCKEPLLAPGAEPSKGGKSASLACGRPPRREQGAAPSLPAAEGGRLKGAAWRRLKAKQLLIYNVAEREMVAKKDKDAEIAGILQPPRLRRVKPLECVCVAGGGSALSPSGCPPHPRCESRGGEGGDAQGCLGTHTAPSGLGLWVQVCPSSQPPQAAFGAELDLLPPCLGEGRLGGTPRAGLGAKAPPCLGSGLGSGWLRSRAKMEQLPEEQAAPALGSRVSRGCPPAGCSPTGKVGGTEGVQGRGEVCSSRRAIRLGLPFCKGFCSSGFSDLGNLQARLAFSTWLHRSGLGPPARDGDQPAPHLLPSLSSIHSQ